MGWASAGLPVCLTMEAMTTLATQSAEVLVILSTDLQGARGGRISAAELVEAGAVGVNYFVRRPVGGLAVEQIAPLVGRGDGRAVRGYAGQLWTFANVPTGTLVVTNPLQAGRVRYLCGRLTTPYGYRPDLFPEHPHVRGVDWVASLPAGTRLDGNPTTTVRPVQREDLLQLVREVCSSRDPGRRPALGTS